MAGVYRSRELPVLAEEDRPGTWQVHCDEGMQQARGQAPLDDQPAELRFTGEVLVEVQRVSVPGNLREGFHVRSRPRT